MSIYCSDFGIGEDHAKACKRWVKASRKVAESHAIDMWADDGHYWYDETRKCTCGNLGPWVYQGSHILPQPDHPRGGDFELASIPNFIAPNGGYDEEGHLNDWLRVSMVAEDHFQAIVINREQAQEMRDYLSRWLERKAEDGL